MERYPLHWPDGWPRTKTPRTARFGTRFAVARDGLFDEIRLLGGKQPILSTSIELRRDGKPYASFKAPSDPGAAVYFILKGEPRTLACDRWAKVEDNIQAIRKTVEAIRGIERWGTSEMLDRIFRGFEALPERAGKTVEAWWTILGVGADSSIEACENAYRVKAKIYHPDKPGGSHEAMASLNDAISAARKERA